MHDRKDVLLIVTERYTNSAAMFIFSSMLWSIHGSIHREDTRGFDKMSIQGRDMGSTSL